VVKADTHLSCGKSGHPPISIKLDINFFATKFKASRFLIVRMTSCQNQGRRKSLWSKHPITTWSAAVCDERFYVVLQKLITLSIAESLANSGQPFFKMWLTAICFAFC
jgi:hypothetical protein